MANDYSLAHKERQKSGQTKPKANDPQNKSFMTIEPLPQQEQPYTLPVDRPHGYQPEIKT